MEMDTPYKNLKLIVDKSFLEYDFSSIAPERWITEVYTEDSTVYVFEVLTLPEESKNLFRSSKFNGMIDAHNKANITALLDGDVVLKNTDHPVHDLSMAEVRKLENFYSAKAKNVLVVGVPGGKQIRKHVDRSEFHSRTHRVHLPLVTDPKVVFDLDGVEQHFPAGQFFELDNKRYHTMLNRSDIYRVHLVVDLYPLGGVT